MNVRGTLVQPALSALQAICYMRLRSRGHTQWAADVTSGAFAPEWHDQWYLYRQVRERRPGVIIEFGSGISTRTMAAALAENGSGRLYSVDTSAQWLGVTSRYLTTDLATRVELIHSPAYLSDGPAQLWRHQNVPAVMPDMIYLDGPPLTREHAIAVDVMDLEPQLRPGCLLVVDGRKVNYQYLRAHMSRQWRWNWDRLSYRGRAELIR